MFGMDERLPLYQRLRDEMLAKIGSGEWLPGTPIPTEAELTRTYGVAIGTVRKAVDTLVNDGLLLRNQGRGTFVRRPDFEASFFRFFRQVSTSGNQIVPESRILNREQRSPSEHIRSVLHLAEADSTIAIDRLRFVNGRSVFKEEIWLPESRFAPLLDVAPEAFGNLLYPFYEMQCGQLIASAKETLTVAAADAEIAETLEIHKGAPIVVIERVALGYDRTPLEYRVSRGSADGFRYQIDIS